MFRSDPESECAAYAERLSAAVDGELDAPGRRRLDTHLESCARCRGMFDDLAALRRRTLVGPVPTLGPLIDRIEPAKVATLAVRRTRTRRVGLSAVAASLTVGIVAGIFTLHRGAPGGPLHATGTAHTPAPVSDDAGPVAATVTLTGEHPDRRSVVVGRGGQVRWVNDDADVHHLVIRTSGARIDNVLDPRAAEAVTFTAPGTFRFDCVIHPTVSGTVTVL